METKIIEIKPRCLKAGRAAEYLGISRRFLNDLTFLGRLSAHKFGPRCFVYEVAELDRFFDECKIVLCDQELKIRENKQKRRNQMKTKRGNAGRGSRGACGGTRRKDGSGAGRGNRTTPRKPKVKK